MRAGQRTELFPPWQGWRSRYLPPLLAASTASAGRPNWHMRGPSCPEAKAALNMPRAYKEEPQALAQGPVSELSARGTKPCEAQRCLGITELAPV